MARKQWVMTPARKRYYESKRRAKADRTRFKAEAKEKAYTTNEVRISGIRNFPVSHGARRAGNAFARAYNRARGMGFRKSHARSQGYRALSSTNPAKFQRAMAAIAKHYGR
jgi:hypothetical protein